MNEQTIEKTLQKAPQVRTPAGLLEQLQSNIELPRAAATNHESRITTDVSFRRWLPALGFALWFIGCVVVFGIQANHITQLKRENERLRNVTANVVPTDADANAAPFLATELEQLRKDAADVQRLRAEAEQLRAAMQELATLQEQNQQLRAELKSRGMLPPKPEEDFFKVTKDRVDRIKCVNNLKQVGLAARMWANDSKTDTLPTDKAQLVPYLGSAENAQKLLVCPGDGTTPYEFLSPGASEEEPQVVYARCSIHNNVGLVDGSVQQLSAYLSVVQKDGRWIIGH